ncbi:hypothetical protein CEE37_07930 [candidate division LCP-89 bacterium B3_LCP]|uniref:GWxTD domain-containing protein n=1 Tax=candidate division LCP-89 bacterium B3_LCP TaxID=2012998 RepID=A0A532UZ60_UNCL8|nr:MAG: hypothetical protein CEE37_07930 [candidate division LCP-89 bacterium B3_LCP]
MRNPKINCTRWSRITLLLLSLLFLTDASQAQKIFTMDAARFRQSSGLVYLEVYFMIQRDQLQFVKTADGFEAGYQITLELHSTDTLLSTTSWEVSDYALQLEDITPRQKLPDIVAYNLPPEKYNIKALVTDINQNVTESRSVSLALKAYPDSGLSISDIELATKLQKGAEGSKFYKNGFLVIPNTEKIYGTSLPMLYYFAEIYNLKESDENYTVTRYILDQAHNEVRTLPQKNRKKLGNSLVEVDGFSVASLKSGAYFLKLVVDDREVDASASAQAKFFVYRPEDFVSEEIGDQSEGPSADEIEFASYTDAELDEAVAELKYLMSESEIRIAKKLNSEGKREFLIEFWKARDTNPNTRVNEYRMLFNKRKEHVNLKYSMFGRPGWKSDQGRVYLIYGKPDHIEFHTHDLNTRAYEIWYYDRIEGGAVFVFVDRNNFGDYRLVHSTKKGELYRPYWFEEEAKIR